MRRWAVVHRIGRDRIVRLVIDNVPGDVVRRDVQDLLEETGFAAQFSEAGIAWGNHLIVSATRWSAVVKKDARRHDVRRIDWQRLVERAGDHRRERRLGLRISPELHTRLTLAAERRETSINQLAVDVLEEAIR